MNKVLYLVLVVTLGSLWEFFGTTSKKFGLLLSSPSKVFYYTLENMEKLGLATWTTFVESGLGLIVATIFSFLIMIICFYVPRFMKFILPIMVSSQVIPLITLAPLFIMVFGMGITAKIAMAALISFFPIFVNFATGVDSISKNIHELLSLTNARTSFIIRKIYFPLSMPNIMAGLKVSATLAVIGAIVAEFNGAERGLGKNLYLAAKRLEPEMMMSSLILSTMTGAFLFGIIVLIELRLGKWYLEK